MRGLTATHRLLQPVTANSQPVVLLLVGLFVLGSAISGMCKPVPSTSSSGSTTAGLGQSFSLPITFENTGSSTGFGPLIDIYIPSFGPDGDDMGGPLDGV